MSFLLRSAVIAALLVVSGCASHQASTQLSAKSSEAPSAPAVKSADANKTVVESKDGHPGGELIGTPAKNSKFAKLKIGLTFRQVSDLIGAPDDISRHETGKRWIPFYFGGDAQRLEVLYKGEGCLTYTGGNIFGGGGNELIRITADPKGACMG